MAKLSRKEVGELCGISPNNIAVYIGRDKINLTDTNEIDTEDPKNKLFIEKYARKAEVKRSRQPVEVPEGVGGNGLRKVERVTTKDKSDSVIELFEKLERQKLENVIAEGDERIRKLKLSNEQKQGDFIKTDHAQFLITQFSEQQHTAWENVLEDFTTVMAAKYGLPREEMLAIKTEKTEAINRAREKTISMTLAAMRKFQSETSIQRGRGEHD